MSPDEDAMRAGRCEIDEARGGFLVREITRDDATRSESCSSTPFEVSRAL